MACLQDTATIDPSKLGGYGSVRRNKKTARMSPDKYADAVQFRADQSQFRSLYPGLLFKDLALFLKRPASRVSNRLAADELPEIALGSLVSLKALSDSRTCGRPSVGFRDARRCVEVLEENLKTEPQILFINGYPPADWINSVGASCLIDPEFFRWHLRFRCRSDYFYSSSLPSAFANIVRLRFFGIGELACAARQQNELDALRWRASEDIVQYHQSLITRNWTGQGESIVRKYHLLDGQHFAIEQELAICVQNVDCNWVAVICSDAGMDLAEGPTGPWTYRGNRKRFASGPKLYPTIQHLSEGLSRDGAKSHNWYVPHSRYFQSASLLADFIGTTLDTGLMKTDPFYALTEIFTFCAFSESQFLNILQDKVENDAGYRSLSRQTPTLSNLSYFKEILQDHIRYLRDTISTIRARGKRWNVCSESVGTGIHPDLRAKADEAAAVLLGDFEYLLRRAEDLSSRCDQGMTVIMNNASLAESKRAIVQANGVARLTLVAFFYIPFSFTTSFFGMNFVELGTGRLSLWTWFATSIPIFLVTLCFLVLDAQKLASATSVTASVFKAAFHWRFAV